MRKSSARLKARGEGGVGGATIYEIFKTWEHATHRCLFVSCTYYLLPLIDMVIFCTIAIIVLIVITKRNLLRYVSMTLRTRQSTIHDTFYPLTAAVHFDVLLPPSGCPPMMRRRVILSAV